jgi:hypothetical protein
MTPLCPISDRVALETGSDGGFRPSTEIAFPKAGGDPEEIFLRPVLCITVRAQAAAHDHLN